jgi:hypothetical protein
MVRFLAIVAIAITSVTVHASRRTDRLVNPVVQWDTSLLAGRSRASPDGSALSTISVGVFAPTDVTESLLTRVFDEANAIWAPAGVTLDWHRITSNDMARRWRVTVTIEDDGRDSAEQGGPLGRVPFTAHGPVPSIWLSRSNAEALIRRTSGGIEATIFGSEILMGRALGRALSHELGHYLLKSKMHTRQGLMRARWPSNELLSMDRRGFELTAQERAAAEHLVAGPDEAHPRSDGQCV